MTNPRPTSADRSLIDAISEDLERETCRTCDGIGTVCLCCDHTIDECECGPDAEPCPCETCNGSGMQSLFDEEE